ncbi:unnamed protein product [Didymodactylos carnosus]|uniref:Leucine carboxyl methyltransferase 1 n=1 Tax=Didymodactylos carnosus TaxID=1234261 RepID=A0A814C4F6_9BILA|nr:unnamed protein product [Didymodactylos carnosus]CAF3715937.1 unnamed protein product [Didymodactylos carnosus]
MANTVENDNTAIIETNTDSSSCKLYAISRDYWSDPYMKFFTTKHERKTPEINIGYYIRVTAIRKFLKKFIQQTNQQCQIINLGCGYDTTYFNLQDDPSLNVKHFIDIDFYQITEIKTRLIRRTPQLAEKLNINEEEESISIPGGLHTSTYTILPVDLREISSLDKQLQLIEKNLDYNLPTFFLSECVLIYMSLENSTNLLSYITQKFSTCFFLNFEQINMFDRFGQIMYDNLKQRCCHLLGIQACKSKQTQCQRFIDTNFQQAQLISLNDYYKQYVDIREKQRLDKIDGGLDEKELLEQLFDHYCFCWAYKDPLNIGLDKVTS